MSRLLCVRELLMFERISSKGRTCVRQSFHVVSSIPSLSAIGVVIKG